MENSEVMGFFIFSHIGMMGYFRLGKVTERLMIASRVRQFDPHG